MGVCGCDTYVHSTYIQCTYVYVHMHIHTYVRMYFADKVTFNKTHRQGQYA